MSRTPNRNTAAQEIEIDFFRSEDAPGIARLFHQVYGEGYPIGTYYLPDQLIEENTAGRIISSVARTPAGEVVGHDALILLDSTSRIYENAAGAVLPAFRGYGVFPRLFKHSIVDASRRFGLEEVVGEPVCNHIHVQKMCLDLDFKELGLEVDLMPATAYTTDPNAAAGRVSVLLGVFMHKATARTVHIPAIYRNELDYLYAGLKVERTFVHSGSNLPTEGNTQGTMNLFDPAQLARIEIKCIGSDLHSFIDRLESEALEKDVEIFQVWIPLDSPFAPAATDLLRGRGYFLGGITPCRPNGDGLLMQKVTREPDWESMALYSHRALKIGEMIRQDWKRVQKQKEAGQSIG